MANQAKIEVDVVKQRGGDHWRVYVHYPDGRERREYFPDGHWSLKNILGDEVQNAVVYRW